MLRTRPTLNSAWCDGSQWLRQLLFVCLVVGLALALDPAGGAQDVPSVAKPRVRLVLASTAAAAPARVSTTAIYAKNDPWKPYLASEQTCPGGERTDLSLSRQVRTIVCLLNFARRKRGLHPLAMDAVLSRASARKASEIHGCERFAHSPCGGDWTAVVRSLGYTGPVGENLYLASGVFGAPRPAVDAWLNSTPHRDNLFRAQWREQGVAVLILPRFEGYRDVAIWVSVMGS